MALTNGTVDAMFMLSYGETAVAQGFHYLIYGPEFRIPYAAASLVTLRSVITQRPQVIGSYMRAIAEAQKYSSRSRNHLQDSEQVLRITDQKILAASYNTEMKGLEPRLQIKTDTIEAIIAEAEVTDPRAKKFKAAQFIDRRYLEEMEKSGFLENLWGRKTK